MLPYYAARFPTVEINYTFYRMPNEKLVSGWAAQTPSPYKLTLKAPRRITHDSRLRNCGDLVSALCSVAGTLGDKLGALLFQLPPNFKKDLAVFDAFLEDLPPKVCAAFEFRHPSWLDDEVRERLAARDLALCIADSETLSTPVNVTAGYAYFPPARRRLHARRHRALGRHHCAETAACRDVFVYFKHEEEGKGTRVRASADDAARPADMSEPFVIAKTADGQDVLFRPALANRHGLITGATGTGKNRDAAGTGRQLLADGRPGVPGRREGRSVRSRGRRLADAQAQRAFEEHGHR
jgi:uncharacterized protein YecE (DUF72 family)